MSKGLGGLTNEPVHGQRCHKGAHDQDKAELFAFGHSLAPQDARMRLTDPLPMPSRIAIWPKLSPSFASRLIPSASACAVRRPDPLF